MDWEKTNEVSAQIIELTCSESESCEMLGRGEIDAYVTLGDYGDENARLPIAKIGQSDYYFVVNKDREDLLKDLNDALGRINDENRYYIQSLYDKYVQTSGANSFLSSEESKWLDQHGAIRVGYIKDNLPFCDQDPLSGELTGTLICCEFIKILL